MSQKILVTGASSGFGVDSAIVEPGGFPTNFAAALIRPSDSSRNEQYGEFLQVPDAALAGFEEALAQNPTQKPQLVADAIADVISTPKGQRPFRTVVDNMGMGDAIRPYNEQLEQVTQGIYGAFQMGDMLKVNVAESEEA